MQIEKVEIVNFKSIEHMVLKPEKVNIFVGKNGSGKTSCLEAVRWALTGEFPDDAVRNGCDYARVIITLFGGKTVERGAGKKSYVKVEGKPTTQKSVTKLFEDILGIDQDIAKVVTSAELITAMNAGKLSEFLVTTGLIPAELTLDELYKRCPMSLGARVKLSMLLPPSPARFGLEEISETYHAFYDMRTELSRDLQLAKAQAAYEGTRPARGVEAIDQELGQIMAREKIQSIYEKEKQAYEKAAAVREKAFAELKELTDQINQSKTAKEPDRAKIEFLRKQLDTARSQIQSRKGSIETLETNIGMFQKTLDNLETPICPLSQRLVCSTDKTIVKDEIKGVIQENQTEKEKQERELAKLRENEPAILSAIDEWQKQLDQYTAGKTLYDRYQFAKTHIPETPVEPEKPAEQSDRDKTRLEELNREKQLLVMYRNAKEAEKKVVELEKEAEILNELVEALNPKKGIREKIIQHALEPMVDYCNAQAKKLHAGFTIALQVNNGVQIMCAPNKTTGLRELSAVSSGQRLFAVYLIMDMLNMLSGYKILMMDNLDKMDAEAFHEFIGLLQDAQVRDSYDHVFIAAVDHDDSMEVMKQYKHEKIICM